MGATTLAAGWTVLWDQFVSGADWWTLTALMYVAMAGALLATARAGRVGLGFPQRTTALVLVGIGAGEVLAYISISAGFATTSLTSVVAILSGAFPVPAVLLARRFLGDRLAPVHTLGVAAVVAGTALLVLVGS